jgi:hypothetical protein
MIASVSLISDLQKLFVEFNERHFGRQLIEPVFRVDVKKRFTFRFLPQKYEFVIGSMFVKLTWTQMWIEFFHEMIHMKNFFDGVTDHTANQYHNHEFADTALSVGFYVLKHPTKGWGVLEIDSPKMGEFQSPTSDAREYLELTFERTSFYSETLSLARRQIREATGKPKQFQLKYICNCPHPHNTIRSGRRPDGKHPLKATCNICHHPYKLAPSKDERLDTI